MRWVPTFFAFVASCAFGAAGASRDRASAEGAVILQELRERSDMLEVLVVDLPTHEVVLIRQLVPELSKILLATDETKPPRMLPARQAKISISVVEIGSTEAVILTAPADLPHPALTKDRFVLRKKMGKWYVLHRDMNYEVAQPHLIGRGR